MKNLFFAALAALSLGVVTVPAFAHSTVADDAVATRYQQTGAL
jgi:methionine-rich copper-binding protein CopC